jgi:hypothetical protein
MAKAEVVKRPEIAFARNRILFSALCTQNQRPPLSILGRGPESHWQKNRVKTDFLHPFSGFLRRSGAAKNRQSAEKPDYVASKIRRGNLQGSSETLRKKSVKGPIRPIKILIAAVRMDGTAAFKSFVGI